MKNTFTTLIENFQLSGQQQQDYMTFIHLLQTESEKYIPIIPLRNSIQRRTVRSKNNI